MKTSLLTLAAASLGLVNAIKLNTNSTASISKVASTLAYGLMDYYKNNATGVAPSAVGTMPPPLYWWEGGAVWGGLIDYWFYTNDTSYNPTVTQGLLAQVGPDNNYMPPEYYFTLGNDDQAFWGIAALTAAEYGFPTPSENSSTMWLDLAEAVWNTQAPRWDTTTCGGGLRWQIFESHAGWNYKNSISNGGFFQMSARLARYTGNQTYVDWAEKSWNWMSAIGLIDNKYNVFDGTNTDLNCTEADHTVWSYNPSMMLYGSAMMYNYTNGSAVWEKRTSGLVQAISDTVFSPYANSTNVMYEQACEPFGTCNTDQYSFKAYLARWLAKASIVAPYIAFPVSTLLDRSALAAAQSCSGGRDNVTCGQKWYVSGWDGSYGIGQQLSALETVQSLLLLRGAGAAGRFDPLTDRDVHIEDVLQTSTLSIRPKTQTQTQTADPTGATSTHTSTGSSVANLENRVYLNSYSGLATFVAPVFVSMALGGTFGVWR